MAKAEGGKGKAETVRGVQDDIDALFQLPLTEFTAARNALAARLKKAGQAEEVEQVKALAKPSVAAWAANQLFWRHRVLFDRLIESGEQFRKAQAAQLGGKTADIRTPLEARRAALSELANHASEVLRQAGSAATPDTVRRVTTTLEALSTYAGLPDAPQPGRLTDDVQPPGFETLAALVPSIGKGGRVTGPTRVIPFEHKKPARKTSARTAVSEEDKARAAEEQKARVAALKAAVHDAERALREARQQAQRAEEALKKAAARAKEAEAEKARIEKQMEEATAGAEAARKNARNVAAEAEEAAQAVDEAERALEKARATLTELD